MDKIALERRLIVAARSQQKKALLPSVQGVFAIVSFLCVLMLLPSTEAISQTPELSAAIETLRARNAEFKREDQAYKSAQADQKMSSSERDDYAEFVAGLHRKFLEQCEVARGLGGEPAITEFDCIRAGPLVVRANLAPVQSVQTDDEKRAAIRARLNQLEGAIDEDLLKRQQEIKQSDAQPSGGSAAGGASGQSGSGGHGGVGANQAAAAQTAGGGASASSSRGATSAASNAGQGLPSAGASPPAAGQHERQAVADGGVGDDIVARQLREAAEKESDPALREKLWAEYRKYREAKK
jgi:hypothetical protein